MYYIQYLYYSYYNTYYIQYLYYSYYTTIYTYTIVISFNIVCCALSQPISSKFVPVFLRWFLGGVIHTMLHFGTESSGGVICISTTP